MRLPRLCLVAFTPAEMKPEEMNVASPTAISRTGMPQRVAIIMVWRTSAMRVMSWKLTRSTVSFLIRNWGVRVPRVSGMVRLSHGIQSVNVASIGKSLSSVRRSFLDAGVLGVSGGGGGRR